MQCVDWQRRSSGIIGARSLSCSVLAIGTCLTLLDKHQRRQVYVPIDYHEARKYPAKLAGQFELYAVLSDEAL